MESEIEPMEQKTPADIELFIALTFILGILFYKEIYLPHQLYLDSGEWKFDIFLWFLSLATIFLSVWIIFFSIRKVVRYKKAKREALAQAIQKKQELLEQQEKERIKEQERKEQERKKHGKCYQDFLANFGKERPRELPLKENILITLGIEQDVHSAWDKSIEERNFLANQGYVLGSFHSLITKRQMSYFVKKRHPESALHTFCADLIYQEIRKYTEKVEKYRTEQPDIIFVNKVGFSCVKERIL